MAIPKLALACFLSIALLGFSPVLAVQTSTTSLAKIKVVASGEASSDVTKIVVSVPSGSAVEVYGIDVYVPSGIIIQSASVPSGWTADINEGVISLNTKSSPLTDGSTGIFSIVTGDVLTSLHYELYDSYNNLLASDIVPVALVSYTQPAYVSDLYAFSIHYPQGWFLHQSPEFDSYTAIVGFIGPSVAGVNPTIIIKSDDLQGATLSDYVDSAKKNLATGLAGNDYILTGEGKTTIGGNSAYYLEYTASVGFEASFKTTLVEHGNTVYWTIFVCPHSQYTKLVGSFDSSIATLEISKGIHKGSIGENPGSRT